MPRKEMKTVSELIEHCKSKGIKFSIMSEEDAQNYLTLNNNYFKLSSYRKNYPKALNGEHAGQYLDLEFGYLIELARIDVEVRHILLKMCLDIEHFLKVALIKAVEDQLQDNEEDGYKIIKDYIFGISTDTFSNRASAVSKRSKSISSKIYQNKNNPYCKGLIEAYSDEMPIWAFVELISFGDLLDLITFYSERTGWTPSVDLQSVRRVKQIRNAAAHNNCIINDLNVYHNGTKAPRFITQYVADCGISRNTREKS